MDPKTEDQIERWVERKMNALDVKYLRTDLSTEEYAEEVKKINKQAERYYANL